jgi:CrcB protein
MLATLIFLGGGIGALMRYGLSQIVAKLQLADLPIATFLSNLVASLIVGVVIGLLRHKTASSEATYAFMVVGICGGFSTFSSFAKENLELFEKGHYLLGIGNIMVSVSLCILAVAIGKRWN